MAVTILSGDGGAVLLVYVTPRSGKSVVVGERQGALWVKLAAPPVAGAANQALVELLAKQLQMPRSAVHLISGATSRQKRVRVVGLAPEEVHARLGLG
jgi:uncharacterized protein